MTPDVPARGAALTAALEAKYERLRSILQTLGSAVIAYSGGVDSTLLLKVAVDTVGDRALAVIGRSATYPRAEYEEALATAALIGARTEEIRTEETDDIKFSSNPVDRCYYCKSELFGKLSRLANERSIPWVLDGTIADDLGDVRPGHRARAERHVRSPLLEAGFSKKDVRELSRHLGLPTWNKGSFACLSSRFPYGTAITREALARIEKAEELLRAAGFRAYRVRQHDERTARIEVGSEEIPKLTHDPARGTILAGLKTLGFTYVTVDLEGYRTGSMNEVLVRSGRDEVEIELPPPSSLPPQRCP